MFHTLTGDDDIPVPIVEKKMEVQKKPTSWFSNSTSRLVSLLAVLPWNKQKESTNSTNSSSQCSVETMSDTISPIDWDNIPWPRRRPRVLWKDIFAGLEQPIPKVPGPFNVTKEMVMKEVMAVSDIMNDIGARIRVTDSIQDQEPFDEDAIVAEILKESREITNQELHFILIRRQLALCPHYTKSEIARFFGTDEGCGDDEDDTWKIYENDNTKAVGDTHETVATKEDHFKDVPDVKKTNMNKPHRVTRRLGTPFRWLQNRVLYT